MPYVIGIVLSVGVAVFARYVGFDRDRAFYPTVWIVVVALASHGVFDAVHGYVIENAGVPAWWPAWCLAYDVGAAAGLAWLIKREPEPNDATH
jgi:hypothetical protein